jgi:hypothetical protein
MFPDCGLLRLTVQPNWGDCKSFMPPLQRAGRQVEASLTAIFLTVPPKVFAERKCNL